jgi:serine/threonine protein kinase
MRDPKRCECCGDVLPETGMLRGRCPRCMVELGSESTSALCQAVIGTEHLHYRIESHLGTGGMGEVYQARDTRLERRVAIKILPRCSRRTRSA